MIEQIKQTQVELIASVQADLIETYNQSMETESPSELLQLVSQYSFLLKELSETYNNIGKSAESSMPALPKVQQRQPRKPVPQQTQQISQQYFQEEVPQKKQVRKKSTYQWQDGQVAEPELPQPWNEG